MLKTTIRQALTELEAKSIQGHCLYLIRDEDAVLYVGRSTSPVNRLREHLGIGGFPCGGSLIGECILHQPSIAANWIYEVFTVTDCLPLIKQYDTMKVEDYKDIDPICIEAAEKALILHHRPCLNVMDNVNPTPLPDRYEWRKPENPYAEKLADLFGLNRKDK